MSQKTEIVLEGSYLYFQKDVNYSEENFKLVKLPETQGFHIYAEILSRIETGEFLKILVRYEMNQHFSPLLVRIEKSIGNNYAQEVYKIDPIGQQLHYTFQNSQTIQEFSRPFSSKHYLTSPATSTSAIFTLSKKIETTGRTSVILISSNNDWTYLGPPSEKVVYAEFKTRDLAGYKLKGKLLSASHLCLYEMNSSSISQETPVDLYLSKYFSIPYQLQQGDLRVEIKNLKKP